jgi:sugar phosphate isomerase/epimerase
MREPNHKTVGGAHEAVNALDLHRAQVPIAPGDSPRCRPRLPGLRGRHRREEYTTDHIARVADAARAVGAEISSLCLGVLWRFYPTSPDQAVRDQAAEIIRQSAGLAALAGAKVILLPVGQPETLTPEQARDTLVAVLKSCTPEAEKSGVIYAVENVGQALARSADNLIEIVERVNSPACQVYYDVGNATAQGADVGADMRKLGKRIAMMHVKDWRRTDGKREVVIIGEGQVDWPAVAEAAQKIGYQGYLTLEVPGTADTADDIAIRSRDALRGLRL